jgi:hypothetical protein
MMLVRCFRRASRIAIVETAMSMKTTLLAKIDTSGTGGCPSILMCEDGQAAILGQEVDADTVAGLPNVLPGERAVFLDPDVILAAADKIRAMRHG